MIRIIGIQKSDEPDREFILLQNQGSLRAHLKGHAVMSEDAVETGNLGTGAHVFGDDIHIPPGKYVLLITGAGEPRWTKTKDGQLMFQTYMNWERPVWSSLAGPVHVLNTQHSFTERSSAVLLK
ncbi:MAG: hypothetical protein WAO58_09975 [Fimbriimonadaceae bacterium]